MDNYEEREALNIINAYRPELDGFIFYHAGFSFCKGGFVGVDVFFVLSGYLMTSIIMREIQKGEFTLIRFYERRVRRILPMLYFTIAVCYYPAYKYLIEKEFLYFTKSAFLASVGASNFLFATITKGYFDTKTDFIPLVHTWTLGVEEQFYVILPLLFITLWRFGRNVVVFALTSLAVLSFYLTFGLMNPINNFYMLYTRFWELAIGSLINFKSEQKQSNAFSYIVSNIFSLMGMGFIFISIFVYDESILNPIVLIFTCLYFVSFRIDSVVLLTKQSLNIDKTIYSPSQPTRQSAHFNKTFDSLQTDSTEFSSNRSSFPKKTDKLRKNLNSSKIADTLNFVYRKMPPAHLFGDGRGNPIGKRCFKTHAYGTKHTEPQLCRLGIDKQKSPVYFLFGDSLSMVMSSVFDQLEPPGMFASHSGNYCPTVMRPNKNSTPSRVHHSGFLLACI
jgi:hypothetical protein